MTEVRPPATPGTDAAVKAPPLLSVENLRTHFFTNDGVVRAVDGVNFSVREGETLGLVGESGCGKSITALSIMRLLSRPGRPVAGRVMFGGRNLLELSEDEMEDIRGNDIAMIFQEPMTSLNPVFRVGDQIAETVRRHLGYDEARAHQRVMELFDQVGIPSPQKRVRDFPHQMSGGMRQRIMIAMALACKPKLLIADEPTTALDVTIQAQILELIKQLKDEENMAVIMITHDLGVIAEVSEEVAVMYAGKIVEHASALELFAEPRHPYTHGLLSSIPSPDKRGRRLDIIRGVVPHPLNLPPGCTFAPRCPQRFEDGTCDEAFPALDSVGRNHEVACYLYTKQQDERRSDGAPTIDPASPLAEEIAGVTLAQTDAASSTPQIQPADDVMYDIKGLTKWFPIKGGFMRRTVANVQAVDDVSFTIRRRETVGLVGESGCGKTTTGRLLLRLIEPTAGQLRFEGRDIRALSYGEMKRLRGEMQIIFQDPYASLNPRLPVGDIIGEGLYNLGMHHHSEREKRVADMLERVGLRKYYINRYPHEFSGGQRQRIGIARALVLRPKFIVADEPVSALDVSIQSQVLNLLKDLQEEFGLTYLFISHNLHVVEHVSDRVGVMYLGKLVEMASGEELYKNPRHPYTQALLSAIPLPDPTRKRERVLLRGDVPSAINPPTGCRFHTRCPIAQEICKHEEPRFEPKGRPDHLAACHFSETEQVEKLAEQVAI